MLAIHPYRRPTTLAKLDQRTKEARLVRDARAELVRHVGGTPSATQAALIDQLAQLRLRLAVMDRRFAETGAQTDHDSRTYLAWANSYARLLRQLGMIGTPQRPRTLAEHLAEKAAAARASAPPVAPAAAPGQSSPPTPTPAQRLPAGAPAA